MIKRSSEIVPNVLMRKSSKHTVILPNGIIKFATKVSTLRSPHLKQNIFDTSDEISDEITMELIAPFNIEKIVCSPSPSNKAGAKFI